jgi:hypothetical protein
VPVIITEQDLKVALQYLGKTLKDLLNSAQDAPLKLTLPPNYMLECLHGQHWILAALEILTRVGYARADGREAPCGGAFRSSRRPKCTVKACLFGLSLLSPKPGSFDTP